MGKDLYIRNISPEVTEEDLRRLFAVCGKVNYVHMVKDAKTGVFAGCAFVKMSNETEARDALVTLDDALLIDRTIRVSEARPQKPKPPGAGGNYRGKTGSRRPGR